MNAHEEKRSALVVAVWKYEDSRFRRLRSPSADAEALARVLGDNEVGAYAVETSLNEDEGRVTRRLEGFFADRGRHDQLLLHLSCHGVKDAGGELYFAVADTKLDLLNATAIPASLVTKLVNDSQAGRVVVFLDCCYSGAFTGGLVARGDDDVHVVERFARAGEGRAVITASKATEYAFEDNELSREDPRPSVFTSALVRGLTTGEADLDRDGLISFSDIYAYVYDEVRKVTEHQTPGVFTKLEGRLYIARSRRPAELPGPLQEAIENPLPTVRAVAVSELARLMGGSHPGHSAAAHLALSTLAAEDRDLDVRETAQKALDGTSPPMAKKPLPPPPVDPGEGRRERRRRELHVPRRAWIGAAAALVLAAVALAAVLRPSDGDRLAWTHVEPPGVFGGAGSQAVNGLAASGEALAVGVVSAGDAERPAAWSQAPDGRWTREQVPDRPAAFNAVAVSETPSAAGVDATAVGRSGPRGRGQGASIWVRNEEGWHPACAKGHCGDDVVARLGRRRKQEVYGVTALAGLPGEFVAVGVDQDTASGTPLPVAAVWRVDDSGEGRRIAISDLTLTEPPRQEMRAVMAIGGTLFAVGHVGPDAAVWRSTNRGDSWSRFAGADDALTANPGQTFRTYAAAARDKDLVVVGFVGDSQEARTRAAVWFRAANGSFVRAEGDDFARRGQRMTDVAVAPNGEFVAVGFEQVDDDRRQAAVWTSQDGLHWNRRDGVPSEHGRSEMRSIVLAGGKLVAGGLVSTDAGVWAAAPPD